MSDAKSVWMAAIATVALAACGDSSERPATQVAVKVNKDEISVHQVNAQLGRLPPVQPERREEAKKQVVDNLVNQQLLVQQAMEKRLDRDPEVLMALESSRHQILAQAYLQKSVAGSGLRPTETDVSRFYADNPALFAQRRVYRLQELNTTMPAARAADVEAFTQKSKSLTEVANWIKGGGFEVSGNAAVRAAEQLPLASVPKISSMKDGEIAVFTADGRVTVLQVIESQPQPIAEKDAAQFIEQYLGNQRREELIRAELKRLRDTAAIEYVGDFTKLNPSQATSPGATPSAAPAPSAAASEAAKALDKGVSGLR